MMRILHLLSQTELTGAEVYAQNLIQSQHLQGHDVFVISDNIHVPLPVKPISLPIATSSFWTRMANIRHLRGWLEINKIQIIHCHSRGAARHAFWARVGLPIAQITTLHGRQHFSWSKKMLNIYGELLVAVCENAKQAQVQSFKTAPSLIRVVRNPMSIKALGKKMRSPSPRLALLGRSSGPKGKRIEDIGIACFETWLEQISGLQITVFAPQPERFSYKLQSCIAQLNVRFPGQIQIKGEAPNLRTQLSQFDLNICSGRIAIESLLEGTRVLACGEYSAPGLVTENNWKEALASNFGDIGVETMESSINIEEMKEQVLVEFASFGSSQNESLQPLAAQEFEETQIQQQILEIYKAAIFKRHLPNWIPALMYHKIPLQAPESRHRIFVTKEAFEKHLQFFKRKHFHPLTFADLLEYWDLKKPYADFPRRPLLLTFDDGYEDNLTHLQPLLKKYQFKATIFLLADHSLLENTWDADSGEKPEKLMTLEEKRKLDPGIFEIGSHGYHHLHLTEVPPQTAYQEMKNSRQQLAEDLKQVPLAFAYPFGSTNSELADLCRKAGYRFAVNTDQGGMNLADNPHSIFRVNIFPEDTAFSLRKKTAPWYRKYFYLKRKR